MALKNWLVGKELGYKTTVFEGLHVKTVRLVVADTPPLFVARTKRVSVQAEEGDVNVRVGCLSPFASVTTCNVRMVSIGRLVPSVLSSSYVEIGHPVVGIASSCKLV